MNIFHKRPVGSLCIVLIRIGFTLSHFGQILHKFFVKTISGQIRVRVRVRVRQNCRASSILSVQPTCWILNFSRIFFEMKRSHPKFYGSRKYNLIWHTFAMIIIPDRPCFATPCYNGGTCTENAANYTCTCISGYDPASDCRLGETGQYMKSIDKN